MGIRKGFRYPVIDSKKTGELLRFLCKRKNLSVKDIQEYLYIGSNQAIYDWFNGKTLPSIGNFYALSCLLGIPMEYLIVKEKVQKIAPKNEIKKHLIVYFQKLKVLLASISSRQL